jgi:hypothetical protein
MKVNLWWEVYEDIEGESNQKYTIAFCRFKYTAETVARYFPCSKIRQVKQIVTCDQIFLSYPVDKICE